MANGVLVEGKATSLCPFSDDLMDVGLSWYNDPEIIALTSDDPNPLSPDQFVQIIQADLDNEQSTVFGVLDESRRPIGIAMLRSVDLTHRSADLHITIGERACWGRGHGSEAIDLLCRHAYQTLKLHKLISTPFSFNSRMLRCLEKCDFQLEGTLRDALWIGDRFIDVVIMGRINPTEMPTSD